MSEGGGPAGREGGRGSLSPWLVVGLGNPGKEYAGNRHNAGYRVVDLLADRVGVKFGRHRKAVAAVAEGRLGAAGQPAPTGPAPTGPALTGPAPTGAQAPRLVLAKPLTYMNLSGGPVAALTRYYKTPVDRLLVVHDELDLPYGQLRAKQGGGEGGHNGLRSISRSLSTRDYLRVRLGISRPPGRQDPVDYVLRDFSAAERKDLDYLVDRAADLVEAVITHGLGWAQNAYHGP